MSETLIKEFGPDIVEGLPEGQKIKMKGTLFDTIWIWEEFERSGNQVLLVEDVIEELKRIPKRFHQSHIPHVMGANSRIFQLPISVFQYDIKAKIVKLYHNILIFSKQVNKINFEIIQIFYL